MILKKTLILLAAILIMLFSLLNAVQSSQSSQSSQLSQEVDDEKDVEKLIDNASYCYGILEDYPRALTYLNRALEITMDRYVKADVLIKTAYVYFLMGKDTHVYSEYIKKALILNENLELDRLLYRERFIKVFTEIKKKPQAPLKEIENRLLQNEEQKQGNRKRFFVMINAGYLFSKDKSYKRIYGSGNIFPGIKGGFKLAGNFYMWVGYHAVKGKGIIPQINAGAQSTQKFLNLGFKYSRDLSRKFGYKLEASITKISYSEKALGTEANGSASGFDFEAGLVYPLGKHLFSEFYAGYIYASKYLRYKKIILGGLSAGLGFGIKI